MTTQPELPDTATPLASVVRLAAVGDAEPRYDIDVDGFVRRYESRLRRLVLRRLGDPSESEEITQETLLRAYQHRASFATEDELMAWSTVVAQRLVIDRVRVRGRSIAVAEVPEAARLGRDTAEIVVARHEARAALEALEAIPTRQAAILWAREVEGLHYEDIAQRFDITEPAVRSLLHRGRKALRKEFKDRTGALPLNGLVPFAPWLLALRAAGQVRKAAKTTMSNPATATAALALLGVTALSVGPWGRAPHATAPDYRQPGAASTHIAEAAARSGDRVASRGRGGGDARTGTGDGAVGMATRANNWQVRDIADIGVCPESTGSDGQPLPKINGTCPVGSNIKPDSVVIWIGPPLPENETGVERVGVSSYGFVTSCEDVPDLPATECTLHYPEDEAGQGDGSAPPGGPPSQPAPSSVTVPTSGGQR